ncbi:MAG: tetratricopeptide repeat protein [Oligoflexia bacterium]|nr:tetratricopeptide repeat protein [Oligoflexia bacterium]
MGKAIRFHILPLLALSLAACSTLIPKQKGTEEPAAGPSPAPSASPVAEGAGASPATPGKSAQAENAELHNTISVLNARLEAAEAKIAALSDRLAASKTSLDPPPAALPREKTGKVRLAPVEKYPSEVGGTPVVPEPEANDPESGFANDEPVQEYRRAMILFKAAKYPESVLAFSGFLEKFPDHPLAGSAQFHVGESYFLQKEYKLAIQEFERVLTSYDRSTRIAQTLRALAEAEEKVRRTEEAARHRQLLSSLFPHSPYAIRTASSKPALPATESGITPTAPPTMPPTMPIDPMPETHSNPQAPATR